MNRNRIHWTIVVTTGCTVLWTSLAQCAPAPAQEPAPEAWLQQLRDPARRLEAQWDLRVNKDPKKIPALVECLQSGDPDLQVTTLQILGESGDTALWQKVVPLLKNKDAAVREAAAHALGSFGERGAIPALIDCIREGMDLGDAAVYWTLPSDITKNYRYAAVEALNRITRQDFKYNRAVNNFGRIFWLRKIDAWWKQQQNFNTPAFRDMAAAWKEHKKQIEKILADLPAPAREESQGGQEFYLCGQELKEHVENIISGSEAPTVNANELKDHNDGAGKEILSLEEIFVYTPEIASRQPAWKEFLSQLEPSRKKLEEYTSK